MKILSNSELERSEVKAHAARRAESAAGPARSPHRCPKPKLPEVATDKIVNTNCRNSTKTRENDARCRTSEEKCKTIN